MPHADLTLPENPENKLEILQAFSKRAASRSAAAAYAIRAGQVGEQLTLLQNLIEEHSERQAANPENWGFPGDLGYISELLETAINFLLPNATEE